MKFLRTLNGELLNLANVIDLNIAVGEGVTPENKVAMTMFGIIATDIQGKTHELGFYIDEEHAEKAMEEIQIFLELDKQNVLEMTEDTAE